MTGCGMAASRTGTGISSLEHSAEVVAAYPGVDDCGDTLTELGV